MQDQMRSMQMAYQVQQNSRCAYESSRSYNQAASFAAPAGFSLSGGVQSLGMNEFAAPGSSTSELPSVDKCIGQVVLDWEFLHDLDLHLLKVVTEPNAASSGRCGKGVGRNGYVHVPEPSPEPTPEAPAIDIHLESIVDPVTNALRLQRNQRLETVVYYGKKTCPARGSDTPQVVLELDRNAAVHSHKPVENLYLTETLDAGVYVVAVHNYSQRQLVDSVVGQSSAHSYRSFDDFKKTDPGYQLMEKALNEQMAHANDEDGTPEKIGIMTRIDKELQSGSSQVQQKCCPGQEIHGVHYGVTIYTYPDSSALPSGAGPRHPQGASCEELEQLFKSDFFATSECVFNPEHASGYNSANVMADTRTADGKLALSNGKASHVALLKVSRQGPGGTGRIVEVKVLAGLPRTGGVNTVEAEGASIPVGGMTAMNAMRMQHMQMRGVPNGSNFAPIMEAGQPLPSMAEPFAEPGTSMQFSLQPAQQPPQQRQPTRANGYPLSQTLDRQLEPHLAPQRLTQQTQSQGPCASQPQPTLQHQAHAIPFQLSTQLQHAGAQQPEPQRPQQSQAHTSPFQLSAQLQQHAGAQQGRPQNLLSSGTVSWPGIVTAAPMVDPHRLSAPSTSLASSGPQQAPSHTPIPARTLT